MVLYQRDMAITSTEATPSKVLGIKMPVTMMRVPVVAGIQKTLVAPLELVTTPPMIEPRAPPTATITQDNV